MAKLVEQTSDLNRGLNSRFCVVTCQTRRLGRKQTPLWKRHLVNVVLLRNLQKRFSNDS